MKALIAYYSRTGENCSSGSIRKLAQGNTERVAEFIQEAVGGDLFEIKPEKEYPEDYYETCDVAKQELRQKARPAIKEVPDASGYDAIFLGYPNWWGTCPMVVFTFLGAIDTAGKRIIPFCTNEGSGMGRSEKDLMALYPEATVEKGLSIHGTEAAHAQAAAAAWARKFA